MKKQLYLLLIGLLPLFMNAQVRDKLSISKQDIKSEKVNGYDKIYWKSDFQTKEVGYPELPIYRVSYVLPVDVTVTSIKFITKTMQKYEQNLNIIPVQQPITTDYKNTPAFTQPNKAIYQSASAYPNKLYEIESDRFYMGYHMITLRIYPFEYIPITQILNYCTQLEFTINYSIGTNKDEVSPLIQNLHRAEQCKSLVQSLVRNPDDVEKFGSNVQTIRDGKNIIQNFKSTTKSSVPQRTKSLSVLDEQVPDYIIITNNALKSVFQTFSDWKTKKGVFTIIKTTEEIASNYQGADIQEKIRNFIIESWSKWGHGLFFLLGGGNSIVPARMVNGTFIGCLQTGNENISYPADMYYATYKNNWNQNLNNLFLERCFVCGDTTIYGTLYHDYLKKNVDVDQADFTLSGIFLGRIPANNISEASIVVSKIIKYEKANITNNLGYLQNHLYADFFNGNYVSIYTTNTTSNIVKKFMVSNATGSYIEFNRDNFLNALNVGRDVGKFHFVYHMDHGGSQGINTSSEKNQSVSKSEIGSLSNGDAYQIFMSGSCHSANFVDDCFAKYYLTNDSGGGVAYIGNTDIGWSGEDNQLTYFLSSLYNVGSYASGRYDIGAALQTIINIGYPTDWRLHLLGDPEMQVWTNTPQPLSVSISQPSILLGNQTDTITLSNLPTNVKAMICIQKGIEVYTTQEVTGTGDTLKIPINFTVDTQGIINVTVTAHNFIPSETTINANQTPAPNLYISTVDFGDGIVSGTGIGNGNGLNDAGETISLGLGIKNTGVNQANGVTATLNCNSSFIKLMNNQVNIGSLASGATTTGIFSYKIDSLAPEKRANDTIPVEFSLAITDVNNVIWKDTFNIDIFNSEVRQGNKSIVYISDNHTVIAANDTVRFKIDLKNIGNAPATGIKATLTPNSAYIKSGSCSATPRLYPSISHFEVKQDSVPFQFVASSSYSSGNENLLAFKLKVENMFGKVWNFDFDLKNPPTPSNLDFSADTTEIQLTWNCSGTYSGFNVYRCNVDKETNQTLDDYIKVNQDSVTYRYFNDKGLDKLTKYRYKVSAISKSGKEGALSGDLLSWTSISKKTILTDFGSMRGGVNLADINNDGFKEIFCAAWYATINGVTNGYIIGLDHNGTELYNIDGNVTTMGGYAKTPNDIYATPAIGDLQANGIPCLVTVNRNSPPLQLNIFTNTNNNVSWAPDNPHTFAMDYGSFRGSVLSNIDKSQDGSLEIITSCETGSSGDITILNSTGALIRKLSSTYTAFNSGAIAVADLDNSGGNEIIKAIGNNIYIWKSDGTPYKGTDAKYFSISNGYSFTNSSVAVCNIDNVGNKEIIVIATSGNNAKVYALNTDLNSSADNIPCWNQPNIISNGNPSIGDINHDGKLEIVTIGTNSVTVLSNTGNILNSKSDIPDLNPYVNFPILADVDGDTDNEIIFGSVNGNNKNIYAYNPDLTKALGYPFKTPSNVIMYSTPAIADIDNDGKNDLVLGTGNYIVICCTNGKAGNVEWGCERHDQYNTGEYQNVCTPLNISINETWTTTHNLCSDLTISSGNTLTINNSDLTMGNSTTITVLSGASLIIDSGHILNANIRAMAGSNVTIKNNGSITLSSNGEFYTETGTIVDIPYGSIEK